MSELAKLEATLSSLTQEDGAETGSILAVADRILALKPTHTTALQCKVVCCIFNEKFGTALATLDVLEKGSLAPAAATTARFHRAYSLYRMRRYAPARAVLLSTANGPVPDHLPSRHLLAQVHYNLEEFDEAAAIYQQLLASGAFRDAEERAELEANYTAALASGQEPGRAVAAVQDAEDRTSDLVYNAATALIEAGDHTGALRMLQQAQALFAHEHSRSRVKSLDDALALDAAEAAALLRARGTPERRFFNDVSGAWVQMAYVHAHTGDETTARRVLELVTAAAPSSAATAAVAAINLTALSGAADASQEAAKRLQAAQERRVASRLTARQNAVARYNAALLHLHTADGVNRCRRLVAAMARDLPGSELTQSLQLALAARGPKGQRSPAAIAARVEALVAEFEKQQQQQPQQPARALAAAARVALVAVQVHLQQGNVAKALAALERPSLRSVAEKPAGIATRVAWLVQLGRTADATALVEQAVPRLSDAGTQKAVLSWAAHYLDTSAEAAAMLKKVQASVPALAADKELVALIGLCLANDADRMAEARKCLSNVVPSSSPAITKKEIESLSKKQPSRAAVEELGYHRRTAATAEEGSKKQQEGRLRKRRARPMRRPPKAMPADGKAPDPERWVPMPLRSYIKELSERKRRELKRLRALDQEQKRKAAERRKAEAAASS